MKRSERKKVNNTRTLCKYQIKTIILFTLLLFFGFHKHGFRHEVKLHQFTVTANRFVECVRAIDKPGHQFLITYLYEVIFVVSVAIAVAVVYSLSSLKYEISNCLNDSDKQIIFWKPIYGMPSKKWLLNNTKHTKLNLYLELRFWN